jgi:hypothetical protein
MKAFRRVTGRVAVLDRADVDTDQIVPKQFLKRVERESRGQVDRLIRAELGHFARDPAGGLDYLQQQVSRWLEGPKGIAADIAEAIKSRIEPGAEARTVVFIGRLGAFYPFYRTSALLRFLDGAVTVPRSGPLLSRAQVTDGHEVVISVTAEEGQKRR